MQYATVERERLEQKQKEKIPKQSTQVTLKASFAASAGYGSMLPITKSNL